MTAAALEITGILLAGGVPVERLIPWIERGTYQFAVVLTNENRVERLAELIRSEDFPDLRLHLAIAPSPRELPLFISPDKDVEP